MHLLDFMGPWPFCLLPLAAVAFVVFVLVYLSFPVMDRLLTGKWRFTLPVDYLLTPRPAASCPVTFTAVNISANGSQVPNVLVNMA